MSRLLSLVGIALFFAISSLAQEWHTITFFSPSSSSPGGFTEFSGNMVAPPLPRAGTYYLWPGLQPTNNSGVYQEVLDGRFGLPWHYAPGWYGTPSRPWGSGVTANNGTTVTFNNTYEGPNWVSQVDNSTGAANGSLAQSSFPLGGLDFNTAWFAIELYGQTWDFGPLKFGNIIMTAHGTDKSWCTTKPSSENTTFTISGLSSTVDKKNKLVTCNIQELTMEGPA